jgi:hypothetical protein
MFGLINSARNKIQESDLYYSRYVKEQSGKIYRYCSLFNERTKFTFRNPQPTTCTARR